MIKATGSQIILKFLKDYGIDTVFGIPGGSILPLYDELAKSGLRHILVRQEQAAGFMAQGVARSSGKVAVCMATSGPGAMNLLTAIADARSDSIPMIAITGQVNRKLIGTDAFQEIDTFGLSMPITKHSVMVKTAKELLEVLPQAFSIATTGRPGPVLIDVPRDVQSEVAEFKSWPAAIKHAEEKFSLEENLPLIRELFENAKRPVIFCGGGSILSKGAASLIKEFSEKYNIPVCTSLMGLGVMPSEHSLFCGMVGMHGTYCANKAMYNSDLIFAIGVRFDDRATGLIEKFCPNAEIIHIDIDAAEINKIYQSTVAVAHDAAQSVKLIMNDFEKSEKNYVKQNADYVKSLKDEKKIDYPKALNHPSSFIPVIARIAKEVCKNPPFVATDVGQHQMWVAQNYPLDFPRQLLTSGSLGTMGFGLPAANGAAVANPERKVLCFSGDGSIMMNVQELATLAEENLDVTVIVLDNSCLGMVRQQQEYLFDKNYSASVYRKNPVLTDIAKGFNIKTYDISFNDDFEKLIREALSEKGPCFIRLKIDQAYNILPFVPAGKANVEAWGLLN